MYIRNSTGGFTLIEVLVSILILAVVLTGGIALYFNADAIMAGAVHKKIATEIASNEMEEIKRQNYAEINSQSAFSVPIGNFNGQRVVTVTPLDLSDPADGVDDYKRVLLEIKWSDPSGAGDRKIQLSTLIAK